MKYKFAPLLAFLILCSVSSVGVYAEEEEDEEEEEDRPGFGIQEREREREHQEESSPFSGAILYATIGAIVAAVGYTAFKIIRSRRATKKLQ